MPVSEPIQELPSSCPLASHSQHGIPVGNYSSCPVGNETRAATAASPVCVDNLIPTDLETSSGLSNLRVTSSIPRSGLVQADENNAGHLNWQYPSPAMFYAAVERKGHTGALAALKENPNDLETIVHIHNVVNEKAWREVLAYEKYHSSSPSSATAWRDHGPKLKRFIGRPNELSPKAKILCQLFGYQRPFDRHDWYVERDNGTIVRYIIDFYSGQPKTIPSSFLDPQQSSITVPSIYLDVRPELSFEGVMDRIRMKLSSFF